MESNKFYINEAAFSHLLKIVDLTKKGRTESGLFCLACYCLVKHVSPSDYHAAEGEHNQEHRDQAPL